MNEIYTSESVSVNCELVDVVGGCWVSAMIVGCEYFPSHSVWGCFLCFLYLRTKLLDHPIIVSLNVSPEPSSSADFSLSLGYLINSHEIPATA
jgi:hypothetical protein